MVSSAEDFEDVRLEFAQESKEGAGRRLGLFALLQFDCDYGATLAFKLLRYAQLQLLAGSWRSEEVFFTEQDQVRRAGVSQTSAWRAWVGPCQSS